MSGGFELWCGDFVHFIEHFDPGLDLGGFARFVAETLDKALLLSEIFLLGSVVFELDFGSFLFFDQKILIPTVVEIQLSVGYFDDFGKSRSEKLAVVRNANESFVSELAKLLDKHDPLDVEVVGRLVENE